MTRDTKRSQLMARLVGLVYNWWGIFTRMGTGGQHREAITTRPALIEGVAQRTELAREVTLEMHESARQGEEKSQLIEWDMRVSTQVPGWCDAVRREGALDHPAAANLLVFLPGIASGGGPDQPAGGGVNAGSRLKCLSGHSWPTCPMKTSTASLSFPSGMARSPRGASESSCTTLPFMEPGAE